MLPTEAAERLTIARKKFGVDRMAISGGESTLNRTWLIEFVRALKNLNPDSDARIHVDTNGSILTKDYIDELIGAGMTDIGNRSKKLHNGYIYSNFCCQRQRISRTLSLNRMESCEISGRVL